MHLATPDDVRAVMGRASRRPGKAGLGRLEHALSVWTPGPDPGSPAEMRLFRRIQAWGLPLPERQLSVYDDGRLVAQGDGGYRLERIMLEYQGKEFHGPRREPLDDERRAKLEALGWTVIFVESADLRLGAVQLRHVLTTLLPQSAAA